MQSDAKQEMDSTTSSQPPLQEPKATKVPESSAGSGNASHATKELPNYLNTICKGNNLINDFPITGHELPTKILKAFITSKTSSSDSKKPPAEIKATMSSKISSSVLG